MVFTSTVFLFLFLPVFLGLYALLPAQRRTAWILIASYAFYAWWRPDFALVFAGSTVAAFVVGHRVGAWREARPRAARRTLTIGITVQLAALAYFKYAEFGVESLNAVLQALGAPSLPAVSIVLPIGISFYVFQAISYMVDVWRSDAPPRARFVDVAAYIALFPQLIAGPIVRYKTIAHVLQAPRSNLALVGEGAQRFMLGFCKKVLVADTLAPIADGAFALPSPTAAEAWLGVLAFGAQLFFDFSGYSDMAIGLGLILGFRFKENFDRPYLASSITEFWRRWHMSLSRWLRDYLYIPLGGNRLGPARTYVNLMLVMLLGGLWHGAAWSFLVWGAWHGGLLAYERWRGVSERRGAAGMIATFMLVMVGWVVFRSPDLAHAVTMLGAMVGVAGWAVSPELAWLLTSRGLVTLVAAYALVWFPPWASVTAPGGLALRLAGAGQRVLRWALLPLFVLGVMRAITDSYSPFLYFRF